MSNSTYFAHTLYSFNKKIRFSKDKYNYNSLKAYIEQINYLTNSSFDADMLLHGFEFKGFDFKSISQIYSQIPLTTITEIRKKALILRPLLEACLYQLSEKKKFDPEHISTAYKNAIKGAHGEKKNMCKKLKEIYDLTKKYHHGADDGSTLGISWINPNEMMYFDQEISNIVDFINESGIIKTVSA